MRVAVSTIIQAPASQVWNVVKTKKLLFHVMKPLASFKILNDDPKPEWSQGKTYYGKSYVFSLIPVGTREIYIEKVDNRTMLIQSREKGEISLSKSDHLIEITPKSKHSCYYTDSIDIDAGIFTIAYVLFAHIFYRHRQRKWRELAQDGFKNLGKE